MRTIDVKNPKEILNIAKWNKFSYLIALFLMIITLIFTSYTELVVFAGVIAIIARIEYRYWDTKYYYLKGMKKLK